ncbi:hypothetical protein [Clavibacter sp. VKM Ac-2872]|uniref:hypothetical protein n=1 Tax=Clavibacter sp. VKM Ac-2872 TaxID=2783812 RepID=UPI00188A0B60|nr:hypothetical protein [Clavibacter sp. VKM Ac-2872]MBF4622739.1 hypothetical protein [Clavibacter sp. VKM Ac-2872]
MTMRLAVSYLAVFVVTGSIVSQVLAWLSWFSPLVLFFVALVAALAAAHFAVVRPRRRTKGSV